jgi:hypothetical protein
VTQNEAGGIIALTAQTQQFFVQAQRYIGFAAVSSLAAGGGSAPEADA